MRCPLTGDIQRIRSWGGNYGDIGSLLVEFKDSQSIVGFDWMTSIEVNAVVAIGSGPAMREVDTVITPNRFWAAGPENADIEASISITPVMQA